MDPRDEKTTTKTTMKAPQVQVMDTPKEAHPIVKFNEQMEARTPEFARALPAHIPVERFKRVLLTAVQMDQDLLTADRQSLFNACQQAANDGLLPDKREGAMVIFNTKVKEGGQERWIKKVQWMAMIGGIRKKVRNSGEVVSFEAQVVHEKDDFAFELGDDPFIKHRPHMDGPPGKVIAAYAVAVLKGGEKVREVMMPWEIEKVRAISKAKDSGPWVTWYEEMCRKTVARRLSKVLPMSTDLDDLIRRDDELYDFKGASDEEVKPPRPQLSDFRGTGPGRVTETSAARNPADGKAGEVAAPSSQEVPEKSGTASPAGPAAEPEPDPRAEAFNAGEVARDAGKPLQSVPEQFKKELALRDAYQDGWRDRDAFERGDGE